MLAPHVDGFQVASAGEAAHVRRLFPGAELSMVGPGKTDDDLRTEVTRLHVESPDELRRLLASGHPADVLLRVNLDIPLTGATLNMAGSRSPFGMDHLGVSECVSLLSDRGGASGGAGRVRLRGLHVHLADGLHAPQLLELAGAALDYARTLGVSEINLGGGMAVSYDEPQPPDFDWPAYAEGLAGLRRPGETLRIAPGRAITAHCGRYLTRVVDLKRVHGELYAVVAGGTHHLRPQAQAGARGHGQPVTKGAPGEPVTIVGQLGLAGDVLARRVPMALEVGDTVEFALAGAYAWSTAPHDVQMHDPPGVHYLGAPPESPATPPRRGAPRAPLTSVSPDAPPPPRGSPGS